MKRPPRALVLSLGLVAGAAASVTLSAWGQAVPDGPVLHIDVPPPAADNGGVDITNAGPALFGPNPTEGQNPSAFAYGTKILPAPKSGASPAEAEPVYGRNGFAADRFTEMKPDEDTRGDESLQYVSVFNPSVLPFKRMSAMDSVRDDHTLYSSSSSTLQDLPVGGAPTPERDLFWGDVAVQFEPGVDVPVPSVAPDMRILSYEVEPRLAVSFSKDGSDNYFVRSDESGASGTYRLRFMVDAPASYFAPEIPQDLRVRDVAAQAPPGLHKKMPKDIRSTVGRALSRLSLTPSSRLHEALNVLAQYFRAFDARPLVIRSGDVYWDLFESQAGVCRHRAFAFMLTANGLGIPTRYLTNEAHAWVESWIPEVGWMRIDLGGAALRMEVDNAEDKSLYQPRGPDPLDKPGSYADSYTQLEGDINGLSTEQIAERRQNTVQNEEAVSMPPSERFDPGAPSKPAPDADIPMPIIGPGSDLPVLAKERVANKRATQVRILEVDREGYRGEPVLLSGELRGDGEGLGGLPITILLAPAGEGGRDAVVVGGTVTREDGTFAARAELPTNLLLQDYEIYASTPGDNRYAPSVSQ